MSLEWCGLWARGSCLQRGSHCSRKKKAASPAVAENQLTAFRFRNARATRTTKKKEVVRSPARKSQKRSRSPSQRPTIAPVVLYSIILCCLHFLLSCISSQLAYFPSCAPPFAMRVALSRCSGYSGPRVIYCRATSCVDSGHDTLSIQRGD